MRVAIDGQLRPIERLAALQRHLRLQRRATRSWCCPRTSTPLTIGLRAFDDFESNRDRPIAARQALRLGQHLDVRLHRRLREAAHAIQLRDRGGDQPDARLDERITGLDLQQRREFGGA